MTVKETDMTEEEQWSVRALHSHSDSLLNKYTWKNNLPSDLHQKVEVLPQQDLIRGFLCVGV